MVYCWLYSIYSTVLLEAAVPVVLGCWLTYYPGARPPKRNKRPVCIPITGLGNRVWKPILYAMLWPSLLESTNGAHDSSHCPCRTKVAATYCTGGWVAIRHAWPVPSTLADRPTSSCRVHALHAFLLHAFLLHRPLRLHAPSAHLQYSSTFSSTHHQLHLCIPSFRRQGLEQHPPRPTI